MSIPKENIKLYSTNNFNDADIFSSGSAGSTTAWPKVVFPYNDVVNGYTLTIESPYTGRLESRGKVTAKCGDSTADIECVLNGVPVFLNNIDINKELVGGAIYLDSGKSSIKIKADSNGAYIHPIVAINSQDADFRPVIPELLTSVNVFGTTQTSTSGIITVPRDHGAYQKYSFSFDCNIDFNGPKSNIPGRQLIGYIKFVDDSQIDFVSYPVYVSKRLFTKVEVENLDTVGHNVKVSYHPTDDADNIITSTEIWVAANSTQTITLDDIIPYIEYKATFIVKDSTPDIYPVINNVDKPAMVYPNYILTYIPYINNTINTCSVSLQVPVYHIRIRSIGEQTFTVNINGTSYGKRLSGKNYYQFDGIPYNQSLAINVRDAVGDNGSNITLSCLQEPLIFTKDESSPTYCGYTFNTGLENPNVMLYDIYVNNI